MAGGAVSVHQGFSCHAGLCASVHIWKLHVFNGCSNKAVFVPDLLTRHDNPWHSQMVFSYVFLLAVAIPNN